MTKQMHPSLRRAELVVLCPVLVASLAIIPSYVYRAYPEDSAFGVAHKHRGIATSPVNLALTGIAQEKRCLAEAMYYEARGEGVEGQKAIAEVVLQRTRDRNFPSTICGVVYQGFDSANRVCQFSFVCNGDMRFAKAEGAWQRATLLAQAIYTGSLRLADETGHAVAFHSVSVEPFWAATMIPTVQIGNHIFYRWNPHPPGLAVPDEEMPRSGVMLPSGEIQPLPDNSAAVSSEEVQPHV